jgi:hypothetical protein
MHEHECAHEYEPNPYLAVSLTATEEDAVREAAEARGVIHDLLSLVAFTYPDAPNPSVDYLRAVVPTFIARMGPDDEDQGARAFAWELAQQLRDWAAHGMSYRVHDRATCTCGQDHEFIDQAVNVFLEASAAGRIADAVAVLKPVHRGDPANPHEMTLPGLVKVSSFLSLAMFSVVGDLVAFEPADD